MKKFFLAVGVFSILLASLQATWEALLPDGTIYYLPLIIAILALAYYLFRRH